MKKVRYYKKNKQNGKIWFSESSGYQLDLVLPNGKFLNCACEFYRGVGWYITDMATGILVQNKYLPNKTELDKYIKDENLLKSLEIITNTEHYKKCESELTKYKKCESELTKYKEQFIL